MSYYYNYYVGFVKNGKIYPLGPYDHRGELSPAFSRSSSFASDLHESFEYVAENQVSDELRKAFEYEDYNGDKVLRVKYRHLNELPSGSFIKTGYFLIESVRRYENDDDYDADDLKWDSLDPVTYAAMMKNEIVFGRPKPKPDIEGEEIEVHSASEYMYYAYPDYRCKEYEAHIIRQFADALEFYDKEEQCFAELVVLETEG
jgi:hypothetical protein